jgi:hypothetical protein
MRRAAAILAVLVALGAPPVAAEWRAIDPGGDTLCSDGSPYRFFVHEGDPARLLVEFEGGGACWSAETCAMEIYSRRVSTDPALAARLGLLVRIYDRTNPENPFREWTHVYVPYCTGDLHWGNATHVYEGAGGGLLVQHRGAANAAAALRWTFENVQAPSRVAVTGCSAGGYGAILWAPQVMARYPGAAAVHLSDSAAGVVPPGFFTTVLASWDVSAAWPKDIAPLALENLDPASMTIADLYGGIAGHYPLSTFAQYNAAEDATQVFFYGLTRGGSATAAEWSPQMRASVAAIESANPNFVSYTAPGAQHCIINGPGFYTATVNGVRVVDWVTRLLAGQASTVR